MKSSMVICAGAGVWGAGSQLEQRSVWGSVWRVAIGAFRSRGWLLVLLIALRWVQSLNMHRTGFVSLGTKR